MLPAYGQDDGIVGTYGIAMLRAFLKEQLSSHPAPPRYFEEVIPAHRPKDFLQDL